MAPATGPSLGPGDPQSGKSSRAETVAQIELGANEQSHLSLSFCLRVCLSLSSLGSPSSRLNGGWGDTEQMDLALLL